MSNLKHGQTVAKDGDRTPMYNEWVHKRFHKLIPLDMSLNSFTEKYGPFRDGMRLSSNLEWIDNATHRRNATKSPKTKNQYKGVVEKVSKYGKVYWYCTYGQKMIKGSTNYTSAEDASRWREAWITERFTE